MSTPYSYTLSELDAILGRATYPGEQAKLIYSKPMGPVRHRTYAVDEIVYQSAVFVYEAFYLNKALKWRLTRWVD